MPRLIDLLTQAEQSLERSQSDSGIGLTLSTYGIQTFTRPKAWHLRGA